jgi:CRISPR-associated endonuclease Cas3-HD
MKPCAFANQTLLAHALGTVSQINKVFSEQYFEVMSNRLRLVNKYSAEFLSSQVALLAALHDIGKAAEKYQLQFDDACKPIKDYTSFRLHEIGSALFLFMNEWEDDYIKLWSILSLLNHLNAMRDISYFRLARPDKDMLLLKKYGTIFLEELERNGIKTGFKADNYDLGDFQKMREWVIAAASKRATSKFYLLFLTPVIVGDNLDSYEQRQQDKESRPRARFIRSLLQVVNDES